MLFGRSEYHKWQSWEEEEEEEEEESRREVSKANHVISILRGFGS